MQVRRLGWIVVLAAVSPVFGQWESGSDGSDGAFSPAITTVVDLSLAASLCDCDADTQVDDPCRWDCPSPVAGRGVYDAEQWAVVFKYTTVDVAAGATITFNQHPSGAPVVWLATGNVTISGTVNLDGEDRVLVNPATLPYFTRPGPGGFEGGQAGHSGAIGLISFGLGPGSSPTIASAGGDVSGGKASHLTAPYVPPAQCIAGSSGATYDNASAIPLIGGSGGGAAPSTSGESGGAGGGAILVASTTQITLSATGKIGAEGGGSSGAGPLVGGPGSGGAIRLRSATVSMSSGSQLNTAGGGSAWNLSSCNGLDHTAGRGPVRIEANAIVNSATISGSLSIVNTPSVVFPAASPPQLYVTAACAQSAPTEPVWGILSTDIDLNSASPCTVNIEGSGMPVGTVVVVRMIPARGDIVSVNSTPMADAGGGLRTATASLTFPAGRSEIQLRANW